MKLLWILAILCVLFGGYHWYSSREIARPPGVLASDEPRQGAITEAREIEKNGYRLKPLASFDITAQVVSTERYWLGRESDLSPVDLVLAWGTMSDEIVLKHFTFSQSSRFYFWNAKTLPVPRGVVESHTANMHMIPASDEIASGLTSLRPGHIVRLKGYLVEARSPEGWRWRSSLTRTDTGRGACEIIYVESIEAN